MNVLFICSANKMRSKTAEDHFSEKHPEHNFLSAGTNHRVCQKEGTTPLEEHMLEWADTVYVMEHKHKKLIEKHVGTSHSKKMRVLGIPDVYSYGDKDLVRLLEKKCEPFND